MTADTYNNSALYQDITVFKRMTNVDDIDTNNEIESKDAKWLVNTFMVKSTDLDDVDAVNRFWSPVENKFTDSSLGGNVAINPLPQYTRYADPRVKGRRSDRNDVSVNHLDGNYGMGRRYGEAHDDNKVLAYFTFGVARFNNLFTYITNSIDYKQSVIANSGRSPFAYTTGKLWGALVLFVAFPIAAPLLWIGLKVKDFLIGPGATSYYYMEPTMIQYWSSVNTMVSMAAIELGILSPALTKSEKDPQSIGSPLKINNEDLSFIRKYMPDLFTSDNYIDVMAVATKAQRMANNQFRNEMLLYDTGVINEKNYIGLIKSTMSDIHNIPQGSLSNWVNGLMMSNGAVAYEKESKPKASTDGSDTGGDNNTTTEEIVVGDNTHTKNIDGTLNQPKRKVDEPSYVDNLLANFDATVRQGAQYMVMRVDAPGNVSESFRNDISDIGLEGAMKSIGNKVRDVKFSLGGGNIIPGTESLVAGVKDMLHGALSSISVGMSDIATALEGGGNISMLKRWEDSSVTFPTVNLKTKLISPYNNPISLLQNIYIPLFALLAGGLTRSTGENSYTSPHLCSMFMRGHQYIKTGMITSMTITRGTSNLSYNKQMRPLAIDISFTVTDFSKAMSAPTPQGLWDPLNLGTSDDNSLNRYIAALCGRDLYTTMNAWPKMKLKLSRVNANVDHMFSSANFGMRLGNMIPSVFTSMLAPKSLNYSDNF